MDERTAALLHAVIDTTGVCVIFYFIYKSYAR
jgi:hypothetical protein